MWIEREIKRETEREIQRETKIEIEREVHVDRHYNGVPRLAPPHSAYPLSKPSLGLSVVPLGLFLLVDASIMLIEC